MKRLFFIVFASIIAISGYSQVLENDSLNLDLKNRQLGTGNPMNLYPDLKDRNIFDEKKSIEETRSNVSTEFGKTDSFKVNMNIYVPEFYVGPSQDNYLSNSRYPLVNDYAYYAGYRLSDRSWLTTSSTYDTYMNMGEARYIGGTYNYLLLDNLTLSAGSYISKYRIGLNQFNDAGVNASLKYQITDRIAIHGFGQYSGFARKHKFDSSFNPGLAPTTNYGGAFEYKVSKGFGIMGGMMRELNPMTGKWRNTPFIMPVIYAK